MTVPVSGFHISLKRNPRMYLATYFAPCTLMVVVSWISFLINPDVVPGRLGLLLTLLLMLINLNNSVAASSPVSANLNPLLVWIITSEAFVFLALTEYALILASSKFCGKANVKPIKFDEKTKKVKGQLLDKLSVMSFPLLYLCFVVNFYNALTK